MEKDINYNMTANVWDGGTISDRYLKGARRSWDIATWNSDYGVYSGFSNVRRFHGEFTIPDGYSVHDDVMISSVGDYSELGLDNIIAINDNIYVFIYPKEKEINDNNFLDYLAFWTGTAGQEIFRTVNNGELITFHDIPGTTPLDYKDIAGKPIPKDNPLSHTDGWYCEASEDNVGYIMKNSPNSTEFVIDLIVEDYAESGGMDRLELTFTKMAEEEWTLPEYLEEFQTSTGETEPSLTVESQTDEEPATDSGETEPSLTVESQTDEEPATDSGETEPRLTVESQTEEQEGNIPIETENKINATPKTGHINVLPYLFAAGVSTIVILYYWYRKKAS